jgi:hypothetical protein
MSKSAHCTPRREARQCFLVGSGCGRDCGIPTIPPFWLPLHLKTQVRFSFSFYDAIAARGPPLAYYLSDEDFTQAVDPEVIKVNVRESVRSGSSRAPDDFRSKLLERDTCCVWTGAGPRSATSLHIIPFQWGSDVRSTILCWEDT